MNWLFDGFELWRSFDLRRRLALRPNRVFVLAFRVLKCSNSISLG